MPRPTRDDGWRFIDFAYGGFTLFAETSQNLRLPINFLTPSGWLTPPMPVPRPPRCNAVRLSHNAGLGCFPFARRYLGNQCLFIFLGLLRCFTSPGLASSTYGFSAGLCGITRIGLPHSDVPGSMSVCDSPERIAAYRVLLRLLVPSHPHVSS